MNLKNKSMIRDQRQLEAKKGFQALGPVGRRRGTLEGATGFGKTRVALDIVTEDYAGKNVWIPVPTVKLRDRDWPNEIKEVWQSDVPEWVTLLCHASMHKVKGERIDLLVMDEGHHLTERMHEIMHNNEVIDILFLTATYPSEDEIKYPLINEIAPSFFKYKIDQAVEDESAADFEVYVMKFPLDNIRKDYKAGGKKRSWMTTEQGLYEGFAKRIRKAYAQQKPGYAEIIVRERANFIRQCKSKVLFGQKSLKILEKDKRRVLVFCGGIDMSIEVCGEWVYNSKSSNDYFDKFCNLEIWYLGVVRAVDEGVNIPLLDDALIVSPESSARRMVQRIGRTIRFREGHKARIFIACAQNTIEEDWLDEALGEIPKDKIKYLTVKNPHDW